MTDLCKSLNNLYRYCDAVDQLPLRSIWTKVRTANQQSS